MTAILTALQNNYPAFIVLVIYLLFFLFLAKKMSLLVMFVVWKKLVCSFLLALFRLPHD